MPTPAWNPVRPPSCSSWSAVIPACTHGGQRDRRGRRVAGNSGQPGAGSPVRPLRSWQDRATRQLQSSLRHHPRSRNCVRLCLSATCVDDSEPDAHDAGWRAATGYQPRPPAARCLAANRRTPCCRQPPGQARGSVDANMRVVTTKPPIGLEAGPRPTRTRPFTGSARPFASLQLAAQTATPP